MPGVMRKTGKRTVVVLLKLARINLTLVSYLMTFAGLSKFFFISERYLPYE